MFNFANANESLRLKISYEMRILLKKKDFILILRWIHYRKVSFQFIDSNEYKIVIFDPTTRMETENFLRLF